ncbi:MAG: DUF6268 family outer membrane beta-barrel protein [Planctomycetota bacterium]|jgi:hypothetical protein
MLPSAAAGQPQDTDYSLRALYLNAHSEFQHQAQPYRFHHKADPFTRSVRASFLYQGQTEVNGESGDLEWPQYGVNALIPIPVDQDVALLVGGDFEVRDYDFSTGIAGATQDDRYYKIDLQFGATWFVQEDLSITGLFSPGIYSDLDDSPDHDDWFLEGSALATFKSSDDLFFKVGVAADETFDDIPVYPLLGLSYLLTEDWRIDVLLPWGATVGWLVNDQTTFSVGVELEGDAYNIRSSKATGKIETENRVQEIRLFLEIDHRFTEQLSAFGRFGTLLGGDYDIRTGLPAGTDTDGQIEPALYFEAGLGWSF